MPDRTERTGRGRWTPVRAPAAGILWTNDTDSVGFQPTPGVDPEPITTLLTTAADAGRTPTEAFNQLAATIGTVISTGELDTWQAEQTRRMQQ